MSERILLVEDDPGSQDLIEALCAARGYGVDVAADGFLGLRLLSERRHGIVLIDYHLPEMDGYALARLMREIVADRGGVRLVGITADRHGLASRRGADALFDAILVKPLDPDLLYATLDRLRQPAEPPPAMRPDTSRPADALWRSRGLAGRPRAVLCPDLGTGPAAAVGQAFDLRAVEAADLILVGAEDGLDRLRAMRAAGPGHLLPAFDLTGRLGASCDATFKVDEAQAWTRLARICRDFADRRAALSASVRDAGDPATRLLAWLYVGDRSLSLTRCADPGAAIAETGVSRAALMAAILSLTENDLAACEPASHGLVVRLTESGRSAATASTADALSPPPSQAHAPTAGEQILASAIRHKPVAPMEPVIDEDQVRKLQDAIGAAAVARLTRDLHARIESAFSPGAARSAIAQEAHALIAMAGSLGFARLSAACRVLEAAVSGGTDAADALGQAKQAIRDVLDAGRPVGVSAC